MVGKGGINLLSLDLLSFLLLAHARREPDSSQSETSRTLSPSSSIFLQLFVHRPILHLPAPSQSWPWVIGIPLPGPCMASALSTILECKPFSFRFIRLLGRTDIIMLIAPYPLVPMLVLAFLNSGVCWLASGRVEDEW